MNKEKYVLGLDIGISSVGWALVNIDESGNPVKIKDVGVRIFTPGENVKTGESKAEARRLKRGTRRVIRRRTFRLDCIRMLLSNYGFLDAPKSTLQSEKFSELKVNYNNLINDYYKNKDTNPFKLKVEALDRKLTKEELSIILIHYAKHRGYKSNREEESKEKGKVLSEIVNNEKIMKDNNYRTVSEMLINDPKFESRIHNTTEDYKMSVTREMIEKEINEVLDSQIKYGLINNEFKKEYLKIWSSQRHFSEGPGGNSRYGGNLIERMTGECKFTHEPRAPKGSPSSEIFAMITKLVNMKIKTNINEEYRSLTKEELHTIIKYSLDKKKTTFGDIKKCLKLNELYVSNLDLTPKEFAKVAKEFKEKVLNNKDEEKIDFKLLTDSQKEKFEELKEKEKLNKIVFEYKSIPEFKSKFNAFGSEEWEYLLNNIEILDEIAVILTNNKTEESIKKSIESNKLIDEKYTETILSLPNLKGHMNISLSLIRKLNKIMIDGITYDKAMDSLGHNHSNLIEEENKEDLLIPINQKNELKNQRVIRSLSQTRKVINAIIIKYGMPYKINIETARELAKTYKERKEIENKNIYNQEQNEKLREQLVDLKNNTIFNKKSDIKSFDLLKYKLWLEQEGVCAYSGKTISIDDLFRDGIVQVDHILPYSRTFDDGYNNKTLVLTKENQEKGNRTPYEWLKNTPKWEEFKKYINSLNQISEKKRDKYLLQNLTPEMENQMRDQNINDTKNITRYLTSFLKAYLNVPVVDTVNGIITSKLRARWGFNNITHSLQSPTYYIKDVEDNDVKKNRENHLHHALDAVIIACTNRSLIQEITNYEKYKSYIENKTFNEADKSIDNEFINKVDEQYIDNETGEVITPSSFKEYYNKLLEKNFIQKKGNKNKVLFPMPYEDFATDVKARIFERNQEELIEMLRTIKAYTPKDIEESKPIIPSFAKNKVSGSLHEETLKGIKELKDKKYVLSRTSVTKLNKKNLETLFDKKEGNKKIYEILTNWLKDYKDGEEAFKSIGYPKDTNNNPIKKVKLESDYNDGGHKVGNSITEKENIQKILIFKDKESDSLYFAGLDLFDILNIKKNEDYNITVWKSQSKKETISYSEASKKYDFYNYLMKNDFIEVTKLDGTSSLCYITGFTQGKIEVSSYLGDSYDLVGNNKLFTTFYTGGQYPITISTIKSIKKVNLSVLGKITENKVSK